MKQLYALFISLVFLGNLVAQEQIITDRPDQTESSSTIPLGSLQIESGVLLEITTNELGTKRNFIAPTSLFRYGLTRNIELRLVTQVENNQNNWDKSQVLGMSDLELGTKIQIFKKDSINTEVAFLSHLIIPTGTKELTNTTFGVINKLSIAHQLSERVGIGYNIGYNYFGYGIGDFTYSLAFGIKISDKVSIYIEPYGDVAEFKTHLANFDAGIVYLLKNNLQLDFSFGTGLNHAMNYVSGGFSWNISRG